jgi:hypothetical protein
VSRVRAKCIQTKCIILLSPGNLAVLEWAVGLRTTTDRNRQIYTAFAAGRTIEELSQDYGLTGLRIRAILMDENHKRVVSPEPFYCDIRDGKICEG